MIPDDCLLFSYRAGSVSDGQLSRTLQDQEYQVLDRRKSKKKPCTPAWNLVLLALINRRKLAVADASGSVGIGHLSRKMQLTDQTLCYWLLSTDPAAHSLR